LTITGATYYFGSSSSVYTTNNTTVMTYLIIDGSSQLYSEKSYNDDPATGTHYSTTLAKGPGSYPFTFNVIITGTGGSGQGSVTSSDTSPITATPTVTPGGVVCKQLTVTTVYSSGNVQYTNCNGTPGSSYVATGTSNYTIGCVQEGTATGAASFSYGSVCT
jgi:hypothetical protein